MSWTIGAAAIGVGVGWLVVRQIVAKTRGLSTLSKPLHVIRYLPIVGIFWRFMPQLLIIGGIIWITSVSDSGPADTGAGTTGTPEAPTSLCGAAESRPDAIAEDDWKRYRCQSEAAAGDRWGRCLSRGRYTDEPRRGCPGAERCCP